MMRALYTAASGMIGQQTNVDVISNNLANVNTTAYKKDRVEFKDLLYETMNRGYNINGKGVPVNLQVGHGSVPVATLKNFEMGSFEKTENPLDMAIEGDSFFIVKGPQEGSPLYTKDGSFKAGLSEDGAPKIVTSEGYPLLDDAGNEISLEGINLNNLTISETGELSYTDKDGNSVQMGQKIGLVKFPNVNGLKNMGKNAYSPTPASGQPIAEADSEEKSLIHQKFLESSNVQVVEEMVKLIVAQRAYEINSKAIQSSDEMLGMANNLKR